jgi:hypothetical protein
MSQTSITPSYHSLDSEAIECLVSSYQITWTYKGKSTENIAQDTCIAGRFQLQYLVGRGGTSDVFSSMYTIDIHIGG